MKRALTAEQIEIMAGEYIASLYNELENQVVADIARRVAKTDRFTETAEIMAKAMRAQGYSPEKIQVEVMKSLNTNNKYLDFVAENTRAYKQEIKQIIKETVEQAVKDGDDLIANAGEMAWNDDLQIWEDHGLDLKKDNTLRQIQKAYTAQTIGELKNITRTTALQVNGVSILNAYHHELDLAVVKVASGAFTFSQALEDCCRRLGQGGVTVVYPSGKKYSIEAATRMCLKTGLSQMAGKVTEENIKKTGVDYVFVQAHAGARPEHAEWQGKVYTYKGKPSKEYPDFVESTGYGTVTGLKGVNCSHEFYPWWPGDPIPEFKEPAPRNINGKDYTFYEATQEQRRMERNVRNMRREAAAAEAAGDKEKADQLKAKIKQTRQEYTTFSKQAGLRPKTERMKVYESKSSINNTKKALSLTDIDNGKSGPLTKAQYLANKEGQKLIKASKNQNNNVFYNGISEESANAINKTIKTYNELFNAKKINKIFAPIKGSKMAEEMRNIADMAFDPYERILLINPYNCSTPAQAIQSLKEEQKIVEEFINNPAYIIKIKNHEKQKMLANSLISKRAKVEENIEDLTWHELAHGMEEEIKKHELWGAAKNEIETTAPYISGYACQNESEYISQSFVSYMKGENLCEKNLKRIFEALKN